MFAGADEVIEKTHVRYWHKAEMGFCAAHVASDPKRTSSSLIRYLTSGSRSRILSKDRIVPNSHPVAL